MACSAALAQAAELGLLAPVMADKAPLMKLRPQGEGSAPVLSRVTSGALHEALQKEASGGFTADMLALDELAMQIAGSGKNTWLLLSREEGGFPRQGFWLQEDGGTRWVAEPYVDLVVDADSVADGTFEEIFAHELGHVFLRRLIGDLPEGFSRTPHHSFSITDQQTAFDEGWATHFQPLVRRLTRNERLRSLDQGVETRTFVPLWMHHLDRHYRVEGVRQNLFVHRAVAWPGAGDAVERRELSTMFDCARLKNASQMLASEGVLATFFFRQLGPGAGGAEALRARYEPMFRAFRALGAQKPTVATPLLPAVARLLAAQSPVDGKRFIKVLVETSYGALTSPALAAQAERLGQAGRFGDADAFVPLLQAARKAMAAEVEAAQASPAVLESQIGPALWLLPPTPRGAATGPGGAPGAGRGNAPVTVRTVDLNTAEREQLMTLPGVSAAVADRALASRDKDGYFTSAADFARRAGLKAAPLQAMAQAANKAGAYPRE
jgi:DNA uptake protein ComE-like DNA-binding protein